MSFFQRTFIIGTGILVALLLSGSSAWGFGTELSRSSLAGIEGITVRIEGNIENELDQESLTKDKLKVEAESRLKKAGIALLSDLEFLKTKERPMLNITIDTLKHGKGYIFSVTAQLYQHVYLINQSQDRTYPATTWSGPGAMGIFYDPEDLKVLINESVDEFITAYRLANPW